MDLPADLRFCDRDVVAHVSRVGAGKGTQGSGGAGGAAGTWTPQWTRAIASNGGERSTGVAADGAGNIYVVGLTTGDLGGSGNAGASDAYVIKYDGAGNRVWAQQLGTGKNDSADAVTTAATFSLPASASTPSTASSSWAAATSS